MLSGPVAPVVVIVLFLLELGLLLLLSSCCIALRLLGALGGLLWGLFLEHAAGLWSVLVFVVVIVAATLCREEELLLSHQNASLLE